MIMLNLFCWKYFVFVLNMKLKWKSFDDKDVDRIIFKVFFESENNDGENIEVEENI